MEPKKNPTKDVHRYSKHFFLIGLIVSSSIAIMAFEWRTEVKKVVADPFDKEVLKPIELYPVPVTGMDDAHKPKAIKSPPQLVIDPLVLETTSEHIDEKPSDELVFEVPDNLESSVQIEAPVDTVETPFIFVEKMPEPVGGYSGFYKFLGKNMKYPVIAKRRGTEGKVLVEFVIDKNGKPTNLKIINGIGDGCNEEAIRVLELARWEPGKQRGRPVMVKMILPVYFKLDSH